VTTSWAWPPKPPSLVSDQVHAARRETHRARDQPSHARGMLALRALATQAARRVVDAMDESAHNPLVRKVLSPVPIKVLLTSRPRKCGAHLLMSRHQAKSATLLLAEAG
jgi:hypothetical protein